MAAPNSLSMAGSDPDPSSYIAGRQINPRFARIIIILCIGYKLLIFIQSLKVDYLINNRSIEGSGTKMVEST